jgi:hypothetical protein
VIVIGVRNDDAHPSEETSQMKNLMKLIALFDGGAEWICPVCGLSETNATSGHKKRCFVPQALEELQTLLLDASDDTDETNGSSR